MPDRLCSAVSPFKPTRAPSLSAPAAMPWAPSQPGSPGLPREGLYVYSVAPMGLIVKKSWGVRQFGGKAGAVSIPRDSPRGRVFEAEHPAGLRGREIISLRAPISLRLCRVAEVQSFFLLCVSEFLTQRRQDLGNCGELSSKSASRFICCEHPVRGNPRGCPRMYAPRIASKTQGVFFLSFCM
jgi:hypothetical protein